MRTLALLVSLLIGAWPALSQAPRDVNKMLPDIMRADILQGKQALAMWLPKEFFIAAGLSQAPTLDVKQLERELAFVDDYTVLMVQAKVGSKASAFSLSAAQLRAAAVLIDEKGRILSPITELPPKVDKVLSGIRQAMSDQAQNDYRLLVFPGKDADGRPVALPGRRGQLRLQIAQIESFPGAEFTWRLPLSSFVAPVTCSTCKESLQPAWSYCPWCGTSMKGKQG